ncbi:hypothetical protein QA942_01415 [Streptomyces sp. B21-106]|uniref:hypothetical protein n=1 Tax=Streptomyces sp. B21-106 TaxID=3039418 RepID=UPI002FF2E71D
MTDNMQPVTASAAAHAERIRASDGRTEGGKPAAGQSTAERIAQRILPGYRRDEELREQARLNELRARGVITAEDEEPDEDEEYDVVVEDEVDEEPEAEEPKSTAERYAARELERQKHEHDLYRAATRNVAAHAAQQARRIW